MIFTSTFKKSFLILSFGALFVWAQLSVLGHDFEHDHDDHHEITELCMALLATKIDDCEASDFNLDSIAIFSTDLGLHNLTSVPGTASRHFSSRAPPALNV